ncbi:hypothetical protein PHYBLDRAFT_69551 [Phycomyces blakesleeanus NRRL 1555(-)]|uniref:Uncharacterized protein n=1 Tax=Phycomyces blakesleeanus (strain ATCC 8743b / DSM 1359 / FGSC 10004 / NBRC 33097 / NRRL 1555) TaxID=763407 RepID=A0A162TXH8_PHYB8|nr:hypothetical protein PHYBLDRAFT_69551 [Phycomyces blakesleeanus NRRL 1555(-)]OAD70613.1 hypothetical protein PHYBLDRAFT_69551 [Phycomyces blakesleeanus NRRL 1555(-)]|eukprot:XP_018288653.1 hypothetical protein PHYBLDRAFT_69551 [Phycomyces blakesleeanus NRRL 1555(-)]
MKRTSNSVRQHDNLQHAFSNQLPPNLLNKKPRHPVQQQSSFGLSFNGPPKHIRPPSSSATSLNREPFGPPLNASYNEFAGKTNDEVLRKHTEDYNTRQAMKTVLKQAQSVSYGFYIAKQSKSNNILVPAIPRKRIDDL